MPAVFQKTVEQDLHKPLKIQYCADTVFTKDNAGNQINVLLFEDGTPYSSGGTVSATAIRADGATESWAGTISDNTVSVALTRAALDVPGTLQVFIKVSSGTVETTVFAGVFNVVCTETPTVVAPVTPSDVAALIASIEAAISNIPADWTSFLGTIAPTFEPDKTGGYAAGDYVWYPGETTNVGTLYRFTSAHSGTWTGTDATPVVIGNELNDTVRYTQQVHTDTQKGVARSNIGAASADQLSSLGYQVSVNTTDIDVIQRTIGSGLDPNNTIKSQLDGIKADIGTVPDGQNLQGEVSDLMSALNQSLVYANNEFNRIFEDGYTTKLSVVNMTAGSGTGSSKKLIDVDIPANTKYAVLIQDQNGVLNGSFFLYEINSNGQSGSTVKTISANQKYELTATKNVKGLSLYITGEQVVNSGSLGFVVYTDLHKNSNSIEETANNAVPQALFNDEIYGDMFVEYVPAVNGSFNASGLDTNRPNRLRTDAIPVKIGSTIIIENGSLKHACGAWNGTISAANNIRNDSTWNEERETIISEVDGYYVVVFANQDATQNIAPSEFDGSVKVYSSNIYKNKQEIEDLKANVITRNGQGQVKTFNLADYRSNIMLYEDEHTVSGTGQYAYEVILNYYGPFAIGEEYTIGADNVEGATTSQPFVVYYVTSTGTEIRQAGNSAKITASDVDAGLYRLAFGLRPATGTPMPTGSATYTGVYITKGTEVEKTLAGDLREAVESIVGQKTASIPEYFTQNNYIQNKADRINTIAKDADDVFIFISDIHWERNTRHSPDLIQYLASKCNIPKLFDGGDVADRIIQSAVDKYKNAFSRSIYRTVGNHDRFPPITGKNLYYAFDILNNEQVGNAFNHYYFVDNVQQKIRYVILNAFYHEGNETGTGWSYYDEEQKNWFSQTALGLPSSDWDVIVFTHFLKTTSYLTGGTDIGNAIDSFNEQPGHTGKILAVFQGHTHWDGVYHTAGGVPVITITCDKWDLSNETSTIPAEGIAWREKNTIKEQAFDVVILNREARKFTCVRIGAPAQDNIDKYRTDSGFTWIGTLEEREITY